MMGRAGRPGWESESIPAVEWRLQPILTGMAVGWGGSYLHRSGSPTKTPQEPRGACKWDQPVTCQGSRKTMEAPDVWADGRVEWNLCLFVTLGLVQGTVYTTCDREEDVGGPKGRHSVC